MPYFIEEDDWYVDDFRDHSPAFGHYGKKRRSGRYAWGSGDIPYQHEAWFTWGSNDLYNRVEDFRDHYKKQYGKSPNKFKN